MEVDAGVHTAITESKPYTALLTVTPQSQLRRRGGYGYASVELYAGVGEQSPIASASTNTMDKQRFSLEKHSRLGTAQEATKFWAEQFAGLVRGRQL